jgi:hypothetical protein
VLVHPVRHEPTDDVLCHHDVAADVVDPRLRDVPVVDHVVVVEDHHRSAHREHPTLDLGRPRLVVQPGVLLEVGHFVVAGIACQGVVGEVASAPSAIRARVDGDDSSAYTWSPSSSSRCGHVVRVLVEHRAARVAQRVDAAATLVELELERPRFLMGRCRTARPEQHAHGPLGAAGTDHRVREVGGRQRPHRRAVEPHVVGVTVPGSRPSTTTSA